MKTILVVIIAFLVLVSVVQNQTIVAQRTTILQMRSNPACMIAPAAPASSPNPETPRRLI